MLLKHKAHFITPVQLLLSCWGNTPKLYGDLLDLDSSWLSNLVDWPKSSFGLYSTSKKHIFHFHQELVNNVLTILFYSACVCAQSFSCVWLWLDCQRRQPGKNTRVGLPFPPPGDLSNPEIKPPSVMSPALAGRCFTTVPSGKPIFHYPLSFFRQLHNSIFPKLFIFLCKELFCAFNSLSGNWNFFH